MDRWVDYYEILQVHHKAEPEVIEGAFKKLAKKYHPDIHPSNGAAARMGIINQAYSVLKNQDSRNRYDMEWKKRHPQRLSGNQFQSEKDSRNQKQKDREVERQLALARYTIQQYFQHLQEKQYENAYALISTPDKKRIPMEDFLNWQNQVSRIFEIRDFVCKETKFAKESIDFSVMVVEHNRVMNQSAKDIITKTMVHEKQGWRIQVGYDTIRPLISKFEGMSRLLDGKYKDPLTGLLNQEGFAELLDKEVHRFHRHGRVFSLLLLELDSPSDKRVGEVAKLLEQELRKIDTIGRWSESQFVILLPETNLEGGIAAASKIKKKFLRQELFRQQGLIDPCPFFIAVEEFHQNIRDWFFLLEGYASQARRQGCGTIVTGNGQY